MTPKPDDDQHIFQMVELDLSRKIIRSIGEAIDLTRASPLPPTDRMSFLTAVLIRQAEVLHELIGFLLTEKGTGKPGSSSPELRLLAALTAHYSSVDTAAPYDDALLTLKKLGHIVPETLIKS